MSKLFFNTLDVFTTTHLSGNQLGLVHLPQASTLTQSQKQAIAREFNYSETVFLYERLPSDPASTYTAQIFTPVSEIPFAGHPTIGTAVWIFQNLEQGNSITLNVKAGPVTLSYDRATGIATASIPHNVTIHKKLIDWSKVVASQPELDVAEFRNDKARISSIVIGMNFGLVDLSKQQELITKVKKSGLLLYATEDLDEQSVPSLHSSLYFRIEKEEGNNFKIRQRMIWVEGEDAATGSGAASLVTYLSLKRGGKGETYRFEVDQGVEMGRASKMFLTVTLNEAGTGIKRVELRGQAVEIMDGTFRYEQTGKRSF